MAARDPQPSPSPEAAGFGAVFNRRLLRWQARNGRSIPARDTRDPWRLLVLEVMSQQTQLPRFAAAIGPFVKTFPTPRALAEASPADALRAWAGLGYNRRALALRAAARDIVMRFGGRVPSTVESLDSLPGVGPYTARAVAAQAFDRPTGPVDVNVSRILQRVSGRKLSPGDAQRLADRLVARRRSRTWVHAMLDLAALVCLPRGPMCSGCPVRAMCASADRVPFEARRSAGFRFRDTTRWLRGALVQELRDAPAGAWIEVTGSRATHEPARVREALRALADEGVVELDDGGAARLPIG
jgi:A/G-specific adenine glycosylase